MQLQASAVCRHCRSRQHTLIIGHQEEQDGKKDLPVAAIGEITCQDAIAWDWSCRESPIVQHVAALHVHNHGESRSSSWELDPFRQRADNKAFKYWMPKGRRLTDSTRPALSSIQGGRPLKRSESEYKTNPQF